jgi:integrase/recombinase XerC
VDDAGIGEVETGADLGCADQVIHVDLSPHERDGKRRLASIGCLLTVVFKRTLAHDRKQSSGDNAMTVRAADTRLELLLRLMAAEELRRGEIAALDVEDLVDGIVRVRGGSDPRRVRITPGTAAALDRYLAAHPATSGPLVRSRRDGDRLDARSIGKFVSATRALAGVPDHRVPRGTTPHAASSDQAVRRHLDAETRRNLRPATVAQRRRALRRLRRALDVEILDVDGNDLAAWFDALTMAPEGRATELSHVRAFYRWAHLEGLIDADPTLRLVRPRLQRPLPRPIGDAELAQALDGAPDRVRPWLYLAAYAGLRASEIAGLRRQDVKNEAVPPVLIVGDGKGGKQRVVPLAPTLIDALREAKMPPRGPLFPRHDGQPGPLPGHLVSHHANRYLHGLGIADTLHSLRHFFGTEMYRESQDLRVTQEVMGHASPLSTAGYAAWSPAKAATAVDRIKTPDKLRRARRSA